MYQCDLRALGIEDFGELKIRGCGQPPSPPTVELYFNGEAQTLARWPNEGFVGIKHVIAAGDETGQPSVIEYLGDRPERWTKAEDAWLYGYFQWLWADSTLKIGAIDTSAKTLTMTTAYTTWRPGWHGCDGEDYLTTRLMFWRNWTSRENGIWIVGGGCFIFGRRRTRLRRRLRSACCLCLC